MENPSSFATNMVSLVEPESRPLGVDLVNVVKTNKMSKPMDLVALAQQVQKADDFTRATAGSKLTIIAEQIRFLQEQARRVLEEAKRDHDFHHVACNFVKKPGQMYYLYERQSGQKYFSLLSPQEWGASSPHEFLGAYRLEHDQSWTPVEHLEKRTDEIAFVDKILNAKMAIAESPQFAFTATARDDKNRATLTELGSSETATSSSSSS